MQKESALKFPCQFPIKIIGQNSERLEITVLTAIRKHVPTLKENALKVNKSKNKTYTALTVEITAESQQQLNRIYQGLNDCTLVMMTL